MRTTKQLSITIPITMAEEIEERVASGAYASESEVVRDGLRTLFARDEAVENWLRTEVVAAYDELRDDPSKAISVSQVREHIKELHRQRTAGRDS